MSAGRIRRWDEARSNEATFLEGPADERAAMAAHAGRDLFGGE
jgi:hypothetical protein